MEECEFMFKEKYDDYLEEKEISYLQNVTLFFIEHTMVVLILRMKKRELKPLSMKLFEIEDKS